MPLWNAYQIGTSSDCVPPSTFIHTLCKHFDAFSHYNLSWASVLLKKSLYLYCNSQWYVQNKFSKHHWHFRKESPGKESCLQFPRNNNVYVT